MKRLAICCLGVLAGVIACEGSHNDLGVDDSSSSATSSSAQSSSGSGAMGGGGSAPVEPDGPPKLTLANALIDRDEVHFCLLESPRNPADAAPVLPAVALGYGEARAIDLASVTTDGALELWLVTGDVDGVAQNPCRALIDDPTGLAPLAEFVSLGVLPPGSLEQPRSLLIATTGCLGGLGHEDPQAEAICGLGYGPDTPTLSVAVAPLSRLKDPQNVGLQVAQLVGGTTTPINVGIVPGLAGAQERAIASNIPAGAVAPFPPFSLLSAAELGGVSAATLHTYLAPGGTLASAHNVGEAMTRGGLSAGDFGNGTNVVFLAIGPTPSVTQGSWWNGYLLTAIKADP